MWIYLKSNRVLFILKMSGSRGSPCTFYSKRHRLHPLKLISVLLGISGSFRPKCSCPAQLLVTGCEQRIQRHRRSVTWKLVLIYCRYFQSSFFTSKCTYTKFLWNMFQLSDIKLTSSAHSLKNVGNSISAILWTSILDICT